MSAAIPITALDLLKKQRHQSRKRSNDEISSTTSSQPSPTPPSLPLLLLPNNPSINPDQQQQPNQYELPKWLILNKSNGNGIIELSGEAGAGKSQLCLSLCVSCILSSIPSSSPSCSFSKEEEEQQQQGLWNYNEKHDLDYYHAMYITLGGEGNQSTQIAQRLYQMIEERKEHNNNIMTSIQNKNIDSTTNTKEIMKRIHIKHVHNEEELIQLIGHDLPQIMMSTNQKNDKQQQTKKFGVLILDSIAGIFRTREDNQASTTATSTSLSSSSSSVKYYAKRSEMFFTIASQLKKISDLYHVHVIVVNQVTTSIEKVQVYNNNTSNPGREQIVERMVVKPSLGLSWSHCVNDRYIVSRKEMNVNHNHGINNNNNNSSNNGGNDGSNNICSGSNGQKSENVGKFKRTLKLYTSSTFASKGTQVHYTIEPHGVVLSL